MANPSQDLTQRVTSWLERSGFPFELRIAQRLLAMESLGGWQVEPGEYYEDPTGKHREIDFIVKWINSSSDLMTLSVNLVIECKSTTSPWLVFRRPRQLHHPDEYFFRPTALSCVRALNRQHQYQLDAAISAIDNHFTTADQLRCPRAGDSFTEAFRKPNDRDNFHDAVRQVLDGSRAFTRSYFNGDPDIGACFSIPILVTAGPLMEVKLANDGSSLEVEQVAQSSVSLRGGDMSPPIPIFTEAAIDKLGDHASAVVDIMTEFEDGAEAGLIQKVAHAPVVVAMDGVPAVRGSSEY